MRNSKSTCGFNSQLVVETEGHFEVTGSHIVEMTVLVSQKVWVGSRAVSVWTQAQKGPGMGEVWFQVWG